MKLLLDTHIWIWNVGAPEKLRKRVAEAIQNEENELWLSPISIWELSILVKKGRIELDDQVDAWVREPLRRRRSAKPHLRMRLPVKYRNCVFRTRIPPTTSLQLPRESLI